MYKIIEWNINQATNIYNKNKIPEFVGIEIIESAPEIIILTEFSNCIDVEEFIRVVFTERGYNYKMTCNTTRTERQNEVLIAWKTNEFELMYADDMVRTGYHNNYPNYLALHMKEKNTEKEFCVIGVRITTDKLFERKKQMEYLLEKTKKYKRAIIGGDFNNNRRGFDGEWSIKTLNNLSEEYAFEVITPKGSSIYENNLPYEYEFPEDHFVVRNIFIKKQEYSRDFTKRAPEIYVQGFHFNRYCRMRRSVVWSIKYGTGIPDHAILIGEFSL